MFLSSEQYVNLSPQTLKIVAYKSIEEDQQLIKRLTELYACDQIRNEKETLLNSLFFLI